MNFIDCNCAVGKPANTKHFLCDTLASTLVQRLKECYVDKAVCWHYFSKEGAPQDGNEMVAAVAKEMPQIIPAMVLLPKHTQEVFSGKQIQDFVGTNRVGAIRIFPKTHMFSLENYASKDIYQTAKELSLPIMFDFEQTDADTLYKVASQNGEVNFIITSIYYRNLRFLFPLLAECPNIYLETAFLKTFGSIEILCQEYGAQRLVYGSGAPEYDMGAAKGLILSANISNEQKGMIASENICRLMGEKI